MLVPAEIYPTYRCSEQQSRGWECIVMTASSLTAKVRFTTARTSDGRSYADERLPFGYNRLMRHAHVAVPHTLSIAQCSTDRHRAPGGTRHKGSVGL